MTEVAPQLDYAPPTGRRWLRRALILVAVVAVTAVAVRWGPAFKEHAGVLLDQRRCLSHRVPVDQVVYNTPLGQDGLRGNVKASYTPTCWTRFKAKPGPAAVLFLHGLKSPSGKSRIVCIEAEPTYIGAFAGPTLRAVWTCRVLEPRFFGRPKDFPISPNAEDFITEGFLGNIDRVFAGQPDPTDSSHFVIQFERRGERHKVEGWLQDDDTVRFRLRLAWE